jgi:post-segregation antitoxin (ccd killing protein)
MPEEVLHVTIPADLAKEFRARILDLYGVERGALSRAVAEAIRLWLKQKEAPAKKK